MNKYLAGYIFAGESIFAVADNNIKVQSKGLPAKVVTQIVKNQEPPEIALKNSIQEEKIVKTTKKLLVLVENISDSQKEMMANILKAAKYSSENTHLFDINRMTARIELGPATHFVISFGVDLSKISCSSAFQKYIPSEFNSAKIILSDSLSVLEENKNGEKQTLWKAMKTMFEL